MDVKTRLIEGNAFWRDTPRLPGVISLVLRLKEEKDRLRRGTAPVTDAKAKFLASKETFALWGKHG